MADDEAVGWDAIDEALARVYGAREPMHYGTALPYALGGEDPIDGISVYKNTEPASHFHFVTYGFSELYEKVSDITEVSGFGFELTFRLACGESEEEPPVWAVNLLQNLARYVFSSGNAFDAGHHVNLNGPIALDEETGITAMALTLDPALGSISTEHGDVKFLQIVGIWEDEYELMKRWSTEGVLEALGRFVPSLVTDIARPSILADPELARELNEAAEREGSSQGEILVSTAMWEKTGNLTHVTIGASAVSQIVSLLDARLAHGEAFLLTGKRQTIVFEPGSTSGAHIEDDALCLSLDDKARAELAQTLEVRRGLYRLSALPELLIEVVPSEIRDQDGNVTEIIG